MFAGPKGTLFLCVSNLPCIHQKETEKTHPGYNCIQDYLSNIIVKNVNATYLFLLMTFKNINYLQFAYCHVKKGYTEKSILLWCLNTFSPFTKQGN